ncbi:MAG: hypothetical protein ACJARD_001379 [Alphaproteobacteria bacterium]|jgi:hypothetical protein
MLGIRKNYDIMYKIKSKHVLNGEIHVDNSKAIRYDVIVQEAMLGVVKKVLVDAQKDGLHNDHHFYLTYSTCFDGVEIPSSLLSKYPDEITIVLQHEFENLVVNEDHFLVTLWFNNVPAYLRVPFKAIKAFFDPSVKFGLQFNLIDDSVDDEDHVQAEVTTLGAHQVTDDSSEKADPKVKKAVKSTKAADTKKKVVKKSLVKDQQSADKAKPEKNASDNIINLDSFRKK